MVKDYIFHASMALALARIGAATLSVSDLRLPMGLRVDAVITDARVLVGNPANLPIIPADFTWTEGDGKHIEDRFVSPGGDEVARNRARDLRIDRHAESDCRHSRFRNATN